MNFKSTSELPLPSDIDYNDVLESEEVDIEYLIRVIFSQDDDTTKGGNDQ